MGVGGVGIGAIGVGATVSVCLDRSACVAEVGYVSV